MYLLIAIRQTILIQHPGNYVKVKVFNNMLGADIFRNSLQNNCVCPETPDGWLTDYGGFGCSKWHPDALLARTKHCIQIIKVSESP